MESKKLLSKALVALDALEDLEDYSVTHDNVYLELITEAILNVKMIKINTEADMLLEEGNL